MKKPTAKQIEELMIETDVFDTSKYPAMTYEQGVSAALAWVMGKGEHPIDD